MFTRAGLHALQTIYNMLTSNGEMEARQKEHAVEVFKSPHFMPAGEPPQVHYAPSSTGFLQSIPVFPNMQDALASFDH